MQINSGTPADKLTVSWRKSRFSNPSGCCVEVAGLQRNAVAVRDSRHPSGPALIFDRAGFAAFLERVKNGDFDDLAQTPA